MLLGKKRSTNWLGKPVVEGEDCGKPKGCPPHKHVTERGRWAITLGQKVRKQKEQMHRSVNKRIQHSGSRSNANMLQNARATKHSSEGATLIAKMLQDAN